VFDYSMRDRGDESLYEYLYRLIRRDIESGVIAAHQKLPSKRALAKRLEVALVTVEAAYAQLIAEGYVYALERRGYYASPLEPTSQRPGSFDGLAEYAHMLARWEGAPSGAFVELERADALAAARPVADFGKVDPPAGTAPYTAWAKALREVVVRGTEGDLLGEVHPLGAPRLREQIARHLREQRGMVVGADQIVVGAGRQVLYNLVVQLLGRESGYAVEEPGPSLPGKVYRANDVFVSHVMLDGDGVRLDDLRASGASVLHTMPEHQYPTGLVASIGRRYELLGWATERENRWIVEDDPDGEFKLSGKPVPTLQSIDAGACVIYIGTFSRAMGPAFKLAYMVLPHRLASEYTDRLGFYACTAPVIDQLAMARLMKAGEYQRHVNRLRSTFKQVKNDLVRALKDCRVASKLSVEVSDAGPHFLLGVRTSAGDDALVAAARRRGVTLAPLHACYQPTVAAGPRRGSGWFVMNYNSLAPADVAPAVDAIARAVGETA